MTIEPGYTVWYVYDLNGMTFKVTRFNERTVEHWEHYRIDADQTKKEIAATMANGQAAIKAVQEFEKGVT
jgi:succinate dehydrogenase/fumarate reductase-like Fe-S protein